MAEVPSPVSRPTSASVSVAGGSADVVVPAPGEVDPVAVNSAAPAATTTSASAAAAATPSTTVAAPGSIRPWTDSLLQGRMQLTSYVVKCKNRARGQDVLDEALASYGEAVRAFLWHLEFVEGPTPELRRDPLNLHLVLQVVASEAHRAYVPEDIRRWAGAILARFDGANWGANSAAPGPAATPAPAPAPAPVAAPAPARPAGRSRLPPPNHPIWGVNGIMHGMMRSPAARYTWDPRYRHQRRDCRVFGHNGLAPGAWWPLQALACFHGAHGHMVKGIVGDPTRGAYSIVVSGRSSTYHDLDVDYGDHIWYSADRPNNAPTTSPTTPSSSSSTAAVVGSQNGTESADTRSLRQAIVTGRPVRVLRSAGRGDDRQWAPEVGIRYDGLYTVVRAIKKTNDNGGTYCKFLLRRVPGQGDLAQLCARSPSRRQVRDEGRIRNWY
ncbi:PUA-like domain-containing protein [Chaetomium strumarium]|uniref:PUA-like domain-containing protein n=1 Tax=Chaetomium strumarium TaxID=1170767 RepID=A0AAJ0M238_9PEZI|nr:PUA-like domain-containing protein [Chaetomium strumarium]